MVTFKAKSLPFSMEPRHLQQEKIRNRQPITSHDVVSIQGRYLYIGNDTNNRFFMKGIAFPTPPPCQQIYPTRPNERYGNDGKEGTDDNGDNDNDNGHSLPSLDLSGWIATLEQLANTTDINTLRLYEINCHFDYSPFLHRAAELGIYIILPLTTRSGAGVLPRDFVPPKCYPRSLYNYGKTCLKNFWKYPNVIAGVVGNEVMNDLEAWAAAPCVKAYLNDLASFGRYLQVLQLGLGDETVDDDDDNAGVDFDGVQVIQRKSFPLMYATQHDSPSAELLPDEAIKLTMDYLSCREEDPSRNVIDDNFIFGINIESWCSSLQSFEFEEDGVTESSYHTLWRILATGKKVEVTMDAVHGDITIEEIPTISPLPSALPIVFSEMGCSKALFNRDNNVQPKYVRDWKQIPVVIENGEMSDVLSGFVAYGYDGGGGDNFRMMGGENDPKWDGENPLPTSPDFDNFASELSKVVEKNIESGNNSVKNFYPVEEKFLTPSCEKTMKTIRKAWDTELYPMSKMPSYSEREFSQLNVLGASGRSNMEHNVPDGSPALFGILLPMFSLFAIGVAVVRRLKSGYLLGTRKSNESTVTHELTYGSCNQ